MQDIKSTVSLAQHWRNRAADAVDGLTVHQCRLADNRATAGGVGILEDEDAMIRLPVLADLADSSAWAATQVAPLPSRTCALDPRAAVPPYGGRP
jgi:hypothetical protein